MEFYNAGKIKKLEKDAVVKAALSRLTKSAVIVPLYRDMDGDLRLVLVLRTKWGVHGGQLAFPGGKHEKEDSSMRDTALRETFEEIGLSSDRIEILEELPAVDTRTTGFLIFPFLSRIIRPDQWQPDKQEIDEIIEVRVADLMRPESSGSEIRHYSFWPEPRLTPFYRVGERKLWGATYRILYPLLPRLAGGEWEI